MSDLLLAPDPFNGSSTEEASDFLDRFKHFAAYKQLSSEQKAPTFPLLLRETATAWYSTLEDDVTKKFETIEAKFKDRYGIQTHKALSHVADIFQRKRKVNENVMNYLAYMRRQAKLVNLLTQQILQAIVRGLNSTIRPFILQKNTQSIKDLEECARLVSETSSTVPTDTKPLLDAVNDIKLQLLHYLRTSGNPVHTPEHTSAYGDNHQLSQRKSTFNFQPTWPRQQPVYCYNSRRGNPLSTTQGH